MLARPLKSVQSLDDALILVLLWLLLLAQPGTDTEPAHARNPVYAEAIRSGFHADGATIKLPAFDPEGRTLMPTSSMRRCLSSVVRSRAVADLLRDSVTSPFLLKVRDQKTADATVRIVDLWFVVRGDLESLDPVEVAGQASGKTFERRQHAVPEPAPF